MSLKDGGALFTRPRSCSVITGEHGWRPPSGAPEVPREEGSRVSSGSGGGGRGSDRPKFTVRSVLPAPPAQMKGTHLWGQGRQTAQQANLSRASLGFWSCSLRQGPAPPARRCEPASSPVPSRLPSQLSASTERQPCCRVQTGGISACSHG